MTPEELAEFEADAYDRDDPKAPDWADRQFDRAEMID